MTNLSAPELQARFERLRSNKLFELIVVNVLEDEHKKLAREEAAEAGEPTLQELQAEIRELAALIREQGVRR